MVADNHPTRDELSSYALQALEVEETQSVRAHLATCPECREILADYEQIANGLLFALPPKAPSPQLRNRLIGSLKAGRPERLVSRRRFQFNWIQASLGLVALVLLAVNIILVNQVNQLRQEEAALIQSLQENQAVLALVSEPGMTALPFQSGQATGNLVISPDGKTAYLLLHGLSALDPAHTYQVWLIPSSGAPQSLGLLQIQAGQASSVFPVTSSQPIKSFAALGITIEPKGGSKAPTTKPILVVNL